MERYIIGPDGNGSWKSTNARNKVIYCTGSRGKVIGQTEHLLRVNGGGQISLQGEDGEIKDNYNVK